MHWTLSGLGCTRTRLLNCPAHVEALSKEIVKFYIVVRLHFFVK